MNDKWKNIPLEPDTKLASEEIVKLGYLEAVHQKWTWDHIYGESLIFCATETQEHDLIQLTLMIQNSGLAEQGTQFTFNTQADYQFVNFNFKRLD